MYGMIHKAARTMAVARFGEEGWRAILERSGLSSEHFISARPYPDEATFALIGAISDHSGIAAPALLEAFGRYWVEWAASAGYGAVLERTGGDLVSFLENLDRMHAGIKTVIEDARLPSFHLVSAAPDRVEVAYISSRKGLEPFVTGLLLGLMDRFGESGAVTWRAAEDATLFTILRRHA